MQSLNDAKVLGITPNHESNCDDNCGCENQEIPKHLPGNKVKLNPIWVKKKFAEEGYILLEDFTNSGTPIKFRCPNSHIHQMCWDNFKRGRRCFYCSPNKPPNFEYIKKAFEDEGYKLIGKYETVNIPLEFICPQQHRAKMIWNSFKKGHRCPQCAKNRRITQEYAEDILKAKGYTLLGDVKGAKSKVTFICDRGHKYSMTLGNLKNGANCAKCVGSAKLTLEEAQKLFRDKGFELLATEYTNALTPMPFICDKGHSHFTTINAVRDGKKCGICFQSWLKGSTGIKARTIYSRFRRKSELNKDILINIANKLVTPELENFYNETPPGYNVDHIIPLSYFDHNSIDQLVNSYSLDNLQYLTFTENCRKNNNLTIQDLRTLTPVQIEILKSATNIPRKHQKMVSDFLASLEDDTWFWSYEDTVIQNQATV